MFGPRFATGLAASSNAQDILLRQAQEHMRNRSMNEGYQASQRTRMAQAAVAQAIQKAMGGSGQIPTQFSQAAPARPPMPAQRPQAPQQPPQQVGAGPGAIQVQPMPPAGGVGNGTTMPGAAPAAVPPGVQPAQAAATPSPQPQAVAAQNGAQAGRAPEIDYRAIEQEIMSDSRFSPEVRYEMRELLRRDTERQQKVEETRETKRQEQEAKLYRDLEVIDRRYQMAGTNDAEKIKLRGEYDLKRDQLNNLSREGIAAGANTTRENVARIGTEGRKDVAEIREGGLQDRFTRSEARARAEFAQRDATVRRGQDRLSEDKLLAHQGKLDEKQAKVTLAVDSAKNGMDDLAAKAQALLELPGLDGAVGPVDAWLPQVFQGGDARAAIAAIDSLTADAALSTLQEIRANSPTGGALGTVSDADIRLLKDAVAPLSRWQDAKDFKKSLRAVVDIAQASKQRLQDAYDKQYGPRMPAAGPNSPAVTSAEPAPEDPTKRVIGKSYKSPTGAIGIWTAKGWQPVPVGPQ